MSRTGSRLAWLALFVFQPCSLIVAQPVERLEQISPVERITDDFYGAIAGSGPRITVQWSLDSAQTDETRSVVLTLVVRHAINPEELTRPDLSKIAEFSRHFSQMEELPVSRSKLEVVMAWRLKPRTAGEIVITPPSYRYFVPQLPEGRRFQTLTHEPLVLTVAASRRETTTTNAAIDAPDRYFVSLTASGTWQPTAWQTISMLGAIYLFFRIVNWFLKRRYPNSEAIARIRRVRVVRETLNVLDRPAISTQEVVVCFRNFLKERFHLSSESLTPVETRLALEDRSIPNAPQVETILAECDAQRFGGNAEPVNTAQLVKSWILAYEFGAQG